MNTTAQAIQQNNQKGQFSEFAVSSHRAPAMFGHPQMRRTNETCVLSGLLVVREKTQKPIAVVPGRNLLEKNSVHWLDQPASSMFLRRTIFLMSEFLRIWQLRFSPELTSGKHTTKRRKKLSPDTRKPSERNDREFWRHSSSLPSLSFHYPSL